VDQVNALLPGGEVQQVGGDAELSKSAWRWHGRRGLAANMAANPPVLRGRMQDLDGPCRAHVDSASRPAYD
jgi:hypothetical protein